MNALLDQLDRRQSLLLGSGVVLLLTAVLAVYLVQPQFKAYRANSASLALLKSTATDKAQLEQELARVEQQVDVLEKELHGDMANLPAKQIEGFIVGRLQGISWRNDVVLVGLEPRDGRVIEPFQELLFHVELQGDYLSIFRWLQAVADDLGFVVIKQFEIGQQGAAGEEKPLLRAKVTMATYRATYS